MTSKFEWVAKQCKKLTGLVGVTALIGAATAALVSPSAVAGVAAATSYHNLAVQTPQTEAVCVFCHTPHGGDISAPVPLWNKLLPDPASFQTYADLNLPTLDGLVAPVGSVSLACLSCHDGALAMDTVLNMPGSGGYNPAGAEIDAVNIGLMGGEPVRKLGTDLRNDHPISIQYAGGGCLAGDPDGANPCATLGDLDFNQPFKATINGPVWWMDTIVGVNGVREKTDLPLYGRDEPTVPGGLQPFVECGSCHDPHNDTSGPPVGPVGSVQFLRMTNTASRICTTCHIK